MEIWVFILSAVWLWFFVHDRTQFTDAFLKARTPLLLFAGWLIIVAIQLLPLPLPILNLISPEAGQLYTSLGQLAFAEQLNQSGTAHTGSLSLDPWATSLAWSRSLAIILIFALTLLLVTTRQRLRLLIYLLLYSALFQAIFGSFMTLSGIEWGFFHHKEAYLGKATGTFVNRNHLAGYLNMALAMGIGLLIASLTASTTRRSLRQRARDFLKLLLSPKMRLRLYLAILVIGLILTRSRMGNTAFFASLLITGCLALVLFKHKTRSMVILLASLVIIDLFLLGAWFGIDKVAERIERTSIQTENRDEIFRDASTMVKKYPVMGTGLGSFYSSFPRYKGEDISGFYYHTHNDYLQFLVEGGGIGFVLVGLPVILALFTALRAMRKRRDPLMRGMAFAATMGITAILIHSAVDFNLQIPANGALFIVLLALAYIALYLRDDSKQKMGV